MQLGRARWYVDADTLGVAAILVRARPDITFPGDSGERHTSRWHLPACVITHTDTPDVEWIPKVTAAGLAGAESTVLVVSLRSGQGQGRHISRAPRHFVPWLHGRG